MDLVDLKMLDDAGEYFCAGYQAKIEIAMVGSIYINGSQIIF